MKVKDVLNISDVLEPDFPNSVLMFYSGSADSLAGKGAKERLAKGDDFSDLEKIPNWRRVLSAFYICKEPFEFDGHKFWTQEHCYHYSKFSRLHPEFAKLFTADSGSLFSNDPALAKSAGGKSGKINRKGLTPYMRPQQYKMDPTFERRKSDIRIEMIRAKYRDDPHAKQVLLATQNAILTHWTRGITHHIDRELMQVRQELSK